MNDQELKACIQYAEAIGASIFILARTPRIVLGDDYLELYDDHTVKDSKTNYTRWSVENQQLILHVN